MYGDSKAHEDTKIRVLLAINRYLDRYCPHFENIAIVTGQPIKRHKQTEKNSNNYYVKRCSFNRSKWTKTNN